MHSLSGFSVSKRWDIFSVCGNFGQSSEILQNTPIPEDPSTLIHASENVHLNVMEGLAANDVYNVSVAPQCNMRLISHVEHKQVDVFLQDRYIHFLDLKLVAWVDKWLEMK